MHLHNLQVPHRLPPKLLHSLINTHKQTHLHSLYFTNRSPYNVCNDGNPEVYKAPGSPLDVSNGICWLTATVIPLTKHDTMYACVTHVMRHTWNDRCKINLTESWSPLKILSALRVSVRVKVEFTWNACFHHVLFTLLMYFMATGVYGYSRKAYIRAIII